MIPSHRDLRSVVQKGKEVPNLSDPIPIRLPEEVLAAIEQIAETCDRSRSWVMVRALKLYLAGEGADILAVRKGREQVAGGDVHDMDKVLGGIHGIASRNPK
nr:MAG TPA: putative transcriptional regulator [Caudoviricetes sp.]